MLYVHPYTYIYIDASANFKFVHPWYCLARSTINSRNVRTAES